MKFEVEKNGGTAVLHQLDDLRAEPSEGLLAYLEQTYQGTQFFDPCSDLLERAETIQGKTDLVSRYLFLLAQIDHME